jgi:phage anti-repressor protein
MEEILLNLIDEIEALKSVDKQKKIFIDFYEDYIRAKNISEDDKEFQISLLDEIAKNNDDFNFKDYFKPSPLIDYLYEKNDRDYQVIHKYALNLYRLYKKETNLKIDYYEEIIQKIKVAKSKILIDPNEFYLLYGYSKASQRTFRERIYDPLPVATSPESGSIRYNRVDVEKWLKHHKNLKSA